mgnify:CR=1 FL=1
MNTQSVTPIYETHMTSGHHWSMYMRRGHNLVLKDLNGQVNVGMLFYNAQLLHEKYNAPDTLKCQHTFQISRGNCLYSDMGRVFCSVVEDEFGGHDTVCGNSDADLVTSRWTTRRFQTQRNDWTQNGQDSFLTELSKYGLDRRYLAANVNWFSRVKVDEVGNLSLTANPESPAQVTLRFEMDTLVILHTCPHPLDESPEYPQGELALTISKAEPLTATDVCLTHCEENHRGFLNNALYHMEPLGLEVADASSQ